MSISLKSIKYQIPAWRKSLFSFWGKCVTPECTSVLFVFLFKPLLKLAMFCRISMNVSHISLCLLIDFPDFPKKSTVAVCNPHSPWVSEVQIHNITWIFTATVKTIVHYCGISTKQKGLPTGKLVQVGLGRLFIYPFICCHVCHAKLTQQLVNRHNITATCHYNRNYRSAYVHQIVGNTEGRHFRNKILGQHGLS